MLNIPTTIIHLLLNFNTFFAQSQFLAFFKIIYVCFSLVFGCLGLYWFVLGLSRSKFEFRNKTGSFNCSVSLFGPRTRRSKSLGLGPKREPKSTYRRCLRPALQLVFQKQRYRTIHYLLTVSEY